MTCRRGNSPVRMGKMDACKEVADNREGVVPIYTSYKNRRKEMGEKAVNSQFI